jgi:hypothetical protein
MSPGRRNRTQRTTNKSPNQNASTKHAHDSTCKQLCDSQCGGRSGNGYRNMQPKSPVTHIWRKQLAARWSCEWCRFPLFLLACRDSSRPHFPLTRLNIYIKFSRVLVTQGAGGLGRHTATKQMWARGPGRGSELEGRRSKPSSRPWEARWATEEKRTVRRDVGHEEMRATWRLRRRRLRPKQVGMWTRRPLGREGGGRRGCAPPAGTWSGVAPVVARLGPMREMPLSGGWLRERRLATRNNFYVHTHGTTIL